MPTYNGVTFDIIDHSAEGWQPRFQKQKFVSREHYPDSNADEVQYGGMGNPRLECELLVYSAANVTTLESSWGSTKRALTNLYSAGDNYANVMLSDFVCVEQNPDGMSAITGLKTGWWRCRATFEQEGA